MVDWMRQHTSPWHVVQGVHLYEDGDIEQWLALQVVLSTEVRPPAAGVYCGVANGTAEEVVRVGPSCGGEEDK